MTRGLGRAFDFQRLAEFHGGAPSRMTRILTAALAVAVAISASACGAPYLVRAAVAEARILWRREPIAHVLARGDVDGATREKLLLVLDARRFAAARLGYRVGGTFATLSRVDDDAVAYVVTAAYRDRLESFTWRFPIVGRVPYRGFFQRERADAYAAALERDDLDTAVWPTAAFSTLGWFADPLLSNMLDDDPVGLVTVVFHELTHARLYLPSAAEFNESFANFVGHRAAIAYFCGPAQSPVANTPAPMRAARCAEARRRWREERSYAATLGDLAASLRALYAAGLQPAARASRRNEILTMAVQRLTAATGNGGARRARGLAHVNNAVLLHQLVYRRDLAVFEDVWRGRGHRLRAAVDAIAAAARSTADPFAALAPLVDAPARAGGA
jgi:predicted aminopeptidase